MEKSSFGKKLLRIIILFILISIIIFLFLALVINSPGFVKSIREKPSSAFAQIMAFLVFFIPFVFFILAMISFIRRKNGRLIFKLIFIPIISLLILIGTLFLFFQPFRIVDGSVGNGKYKEGQTVLSERITYLFKDPKIGDIVNFTNLKERRIGQIYEIQREDAMIIYLVKHDASKDSKLTKDRIISRVYWGLPFKGEDKLIEKITPEASPTIPAENKFPLSWEEPISGNKIIPIIKNNTLYFYSLNEKKLLSVSYKISGVGGESGKGDNIPLLSPDGQYTVFINPNDNNTLYLISGSLGEKKLTEYPIEFLTDWSPDSKKILYYVDDDNLFCRKFFCEGMGGQADEWEATEKFTKNAFPGFHIFNIETGIDTFLFPLNDADQFIDDNRIVTIVEQDDNDRLVAFNIDTFEADFSLINYIIPFGGHQRSFTSDGKYWVFSYSNNPTSDMSIIYAKFPDKDGVTIESGGWANVQSPLISSDGEYIIYLKRGQMIEPGVYSELTRVWDTKSKKIIKELEGDLQYWIDSKSFLYGLPEEGSFGIYHIDSDTIEIIN